MDIIFDDYKIFAEDKITVITGKNGSGKTSLIEQIKNEVKKNNIDYIVLDFDSHCHLDIDELKKFAYNLKEKSKTNNIIIASLRPEIIDIANKVITLK